MMVRIAPAPIQIPPVAALLFDLHLKYSQALAKSMSFMRVDATIPKSIELMKGAGKTCEPVPYEGAGHGFMRSGEAPDGGPAERKAREEGWKRWMALMKGI